MARHLRSLGVALLLCTSAGQPVEVSAAVAPPETLCSISKLKTAATAFACSLRQRTRLATGGSADVGSCAEKLAARFASAESRGSCPTTGDAALAATRADDAAMAVLGVLGADLASGNDQLRCLKKKSKLAARYARCQSAALTSRLDHSYANLRNDFELCRLDLEEQSAELDATGGCATTGEAGDVEEQSGAGYGFLPGTVWDHPRLSGAPLAHAYLVGASFSSCALEGADLRGADLRQVLWDDVYARSGLDFGTTDLRGADFGDAEIRGSYMDGARLDGATFTNASFYGLRGKEVLGCPASLPAGWSCIGNHLMGPLANLSDCDLSGLDLSGVDLSGARLDLTRLSQANLAGATFGSASIYASWFDGANLSGVDFSAASFDRVFAVPVASCPTALPPSWSCVSGILVGRTMRCHEGDLSGLDLEGLELTSSHFTRCDLSNADLDGAILSFSEFIDSDMTGASLAGARLLLTSWAATTCADGTFSYDNGYTCCGHHVGDPPLSCSP